MSSSNRQGLAGPMFLAALLWLPASAQATIINGTGLDSMGTVSGTTAAAIAEASVNAAPSSFSQNLLVLTNGTEDSSAVPFASGGWLDVSGTAYLPLVYDMQETANNEDVLIGTLRLCLFAACGDGGSVEVWSSTENIDVNTDSGDLTLSPLGNGADLAVLVPLSVFDGHGVTEADSFFFQATQSKGDNGNDEWALSDQGINEAHTFAIFSPDQDISSGVIPEPGTGVLLGAGLLALARKGRRESSRRVLVYVGKTSRTRTALR